MSRARKGFTLIEVLITAALMSGLFIGILAFSTLVVDGTSAETNYADLNSQASEVVLGRIGTELRQARVLNLPESGSDEFFYVVPVDADGDGDVLNDAGGIEWGQQRGDVGLPMVGDDFRYRIFYVPDETASEAVLNLDINEDGDQEDVFDLGHLEMSLIGGTWNGEVYDTQTVQWTRDSIVQVQGDMTGDIDGDGVGDPLFQPFGATVMVNIFTYDTLRDDAPLVNRQTVVALRNAETGPITPSGGIPGLRKEIYENILGTDISDLVNSSKFQNDDPDNISFPDMFEHYEGDDSHDNYGVRFRGYIVPPETGSYTFDIAGDDDCELHLQLGADSESTDGLNLICYVDGWTGWREWDKSASQTSGSITLEANKRYYVEALMKEGSGGDSISVRWTQPDGTIDEPIDSRFLRVWQPE